MLEYYFSKVFTILECNNNNSAKPLNDVKIIINSEEPDNLYKVMTCINTIPSTSNTLNNLLVNTSFCSYCIQREFNDGKKMIIKIFSAYVVPLLKYINNPELLQ